MLMLTFKLLFLFIFMCMFMFLVVFLVVLERACTCLSLTSKKPFNIMTIIQSRAGRHVPWLGAWRTPWTMWHGRQLPTIASVEFLRQREGDQQGEFSFSVCSERIVDQRTVCFFCAMLLTFRGCVRGSEGAKSNTFEKTKAAFEAKTLPCLERNVACSCSPRSHVCSEHDLAREALFFLSVERPFLAWCSGKTVAGLCSAVVGSRMDHRRVLIVECALVFLVVRFHQFCFRRSCSACQDVQRSSVVPLVQLQHDNHLILRFCGFLTMPPNQAR